MEKEEQLFRKRIQELAENAYSRDRPDCPEVPEGPEDGSGRKEGTDGSEGDPVLL